MNKQQFESLNDTAAGQAMATAQALADKTPRTLVYGYTVERSTFHVYLDGGVHLVVYDHVGLLLRHVSEFEGLALAQCVPDKRVYPEACDHEFCVLLKKAGVNVPFTTWSDDRVPQPFHGKRRGELTSSYSPKDLKLSRRCFDDVVVRDVFPGQPFVSVDLVGGLAALLLETAESYLRSCLPDLPGGDPQKAQRWLDNLPMAMQWKVDREGGEVALSEVQMQTAVRRVDELVQARVAELMSR